MGSYEPHSIPTLLKRNAEEAGNLPAMKTKDPKTGDEVHLINNFDLILQVELPIQKLHP